MKVLVDANLSPKVAERLRKFGFEASHVIDHGLMTASDVVISDFAIDRGLVIVSADSDFATMLALGRGTAPSLVLFRSADMLTPPEQGGVLAANLPAVAEDLEAGAVVTIARGHLRVRRLPLR
jgi:predicted nuclease of predicted toxin-antitoxin system